MTDKKKESIVNALSKLREHIKTINSQIDIPNVSRFLERANFDVLEAIDLIKKDGNKFQD